MATSDRSWSSARAIRARLAASPYPVLLLGAGCVLVLEALRGSEPLSTDPIWPVLQALVAGAALAFAWRRRDGLTLGATLCFAVGFHLAWIAVHLAVGVDADWDSVVVYPRDGKSLLEGEYPESAYPPGAVLLFALDVLLAGGSAEAVRVSHALVMVPLQAISVVAVWLLRTRSSSWFALVVGFWPLNAFSWEFRFDSAPTAALLLGLLLASRERWTGAGIALGLGAALKWIPGLAAFALILWLLASRRRREAGSHALAFAAAFVAVHLPFLILAPTELIGTYESQGGRGITAESLPYVPLRLLGLASSPGTIWEDAVVPDWANRAAAVGQAIVVVAVLAAVALARGRLRAGIAAAALTPAAFLLTNRVFSPQFFVLIIAAWAVAATLLDLKRFELGALAVIAAAASVANSLVFPTLAPGVTLFVGMVFLFALPVTLWLALRAARAGRLGESPDTERPPTGAQRASTRRAWHPGGRGASSG